MSLSASVRAVDARHLCRRRMIALRPYILGQRLPYCPSCPGSHSCHPVSRQVCVILLHGRARELPYFLYDVSFFATTRLVPATCAIDGS